MTRGWTPARLALLVALLALAQWLRTAGLDFGLPAVYNPDEVSIMSRALGFAKGDLNPHNFLYPTFYFYVLFGWIGGWFVLNWLTGAIPSLGAFQTQFFLDPSGVYLAGRALGVVCGVATVWVTWLLAARTAGWRAGAVAALLLAVAPTAVRDAHYVKHDVPVTLAVAVAMLVLLRLARVGEAAHAPPDPPRPPALLAAGAVCGVAFSTHYYAVFLALPLAIAVALRCGALAGPPGGARPTTADLLRAWAWAATGAAVAFIALSPFLLVEPRTAWQDIVANRQIVVDRAAELGSGPLPSAAAYARLLWHEGLGWPALGAAFAGTVLIVRRRPWHALLLLAFPVAFLLFISHTVAASRYLNPVLPFLAVAAGCGVALASRSTPIAAALAVGIALPAWWQSWQIGRFFAQTDTRTIAQRWIEREVPAGTTVLIQPYSVALTQSRESLVEALTATLGDPGRASTKFALRLALDPYPSPAYRTIYLGDGGLDADKLYVSPGAFRAAPGSSGAPAVPGTALQPLTRLGVQYVVLKRYNAEDPAVTPLRDWLLAAATRVATVSPYRADATDADRARVAPFLHNTDTPWHPALERPGPGLEIWKLPR
nr:dolichyl-phosphate-mannose-protein mannosyltransferase [uncultured bacterium]